MTDPLKVVSSMATRALLDELVRAYASSSSRPVALESVGGVDAAKRVRAGEGFDVVVLAGDVIDRLAAEGRIVAGSRVDVARSAVAVAVRAGAPRPDVGSEDGVRRAVLGASRVGCSTGPSGDHLAALLQRWGIADALRDRLVQARPGVPVAALLARGEVALGFQQYAELANVPGVEVIGVLPEAIQAVTTFAGGIASASGRPEDARALLAYLASPGAAAAKQRHGMAAP